MTFSSKMPKINKQLRALLSSLNLRSKATNRRKKIQGLRPPSRIWACNQILSHRAKASSGLDTFKTLMKTKRSMELQICKNKSSSLSLFQKLQRLPKPRRSKSQAKKEQTKNQTSKGLSTTTAQTWAPCQLAELQDWSHLIQNLNTPPESHLTLTLSSIMKKMN